MQRNKYLDLLGIPMKDYGTNWRPQKDKRFWRWFKQRREYGFDEVETWALDGVFVEWLYSHCLMYKQKADQVVNLNYHHFEHNGKDYSQLEAINYIIEKTGNWLLAERANHFSKDSKHLEELQDAICLWAKILPCMWW